MKECPIYDLSCPYCDKTSGFCTLKDPARDCDDYFAAVGEEEEDESGE